MLLIFVCFQISNEIGFEYICDIIFMSLNNSCSCWVKILYLMRSEKLYCFLESDSFSSLSFEMLTRNIML